MKRCMATMGSFIFLVFAGFQGCGGCGNGGKETDADAVEAEDLAQDRDIFGELDIFEGSDPSFDGEDADALDDGVETKDLPDAVEAMDATDGADGPDAEDAAEEDPYATSPCRNVSGDIRITEAPYTSWIPSLVWTGSEFGVAWIDAREGVYTLYFVRLDSSGGKIGVDVRIPDEVSLAGAPSLVWTGSEYAVAWDTLTEVYFARISAAGEKIGSDVAIAGDPRSCCNASLAWTGSEYGLAWDDRRSGEDEIYFTRLDASGVEIGDDIRLLTDHPRNKRGPSIVWVGSEFGMAWSDERRLPDEIYFTRLDSSGAVIGSEVRITDNSGRDYGPSLVWTGSEYGLVWEGGLGPNVSQYARLDPAGAILGGGGGLTDESSVYGNASHVWTGSAYAFAWDDYRDGNYEIYFARKSALGEKTEGDVRITDDGADSFHPSLAWVGSEYAVVWSDRRDGSGNSELYFARISCL